MVNLEGRLQSAFKASYPPGEACEDWNIISNISRMIKKTKSYDDGHILQEIIKKHIKLKNNINLKKTRSVDFIEKEIFIKPIDYYFTNPIARASKTMSECKRIKKNFLFTGVDKAS